jgi:hypothetical protein
MRFELPKDLPPEQEQAVLAALERYFSERDRPTDPWVVAGRADAVRIGALQARHRGPGAWTRATREGFARRGTEPLLGRGDSK